MLTQRHWYSNLLYTQDQVFSFTSLKEIAWAYRPDWNYYLPTHADCKKMSVIVYTIQKFSLKTLDTSVIIGRNQKNKIKCVYA